MKQRLLIALLLAPLGACTSHDMSASGSAASAQSSAPIAASAPAPAAGENRVEEKAAGFSIAKPVGVSVTRDFQASYFDNGSWKAYASRKSPGTPVLALVLEGSNDITTATLRVGYSDDPDAVKSCTSGPANGSVDDKGRTTIDGAVFRHFRLGDAGMSHYHDVQAYRAVHAQRCYAIDLIVAGVNPKVYSPPKTPPFSRDEAFDRLTALLKTFRFASPSVGTN